MEELLNQITKSLVDNPDDVQISKVDGDNTIVFELRCHKDDIGKVIGRKGRTVGAMRVILSAIAAREGRRTMLEVID